MGRGSISRAGDSRGRVSGRRVRLAAALLPLLELACGQQPVNRPINTDHPPVIHQIAVSPGRLHIRQHAIVSVVATDADNDRLSFEWTVSHGGLPSGRITSVVSWITPTSRESDTLWVSVSDGKHVVASSKVVSIVALAPPESVEFVVGSSSAELTWRASIDQGIEGWGGYNVYSARHSLAGLTSDSLAKYLITPQPLPEANLVVPDLRWGERYYYRICGLRRWSDQTERSELTSEVLLAPRPEGYVRLAELANPSGGALALDLAAGSAYGQERLIEADDASGVDQRDLYVGTLDPLDRQGVLCVKSVYCLRTRHAEWGARHVLIKRIGTDWHVNSTDDQGWADSVAVNEGDVLAVRLPEGNYAKLQVSTNGVSGIYPYRVLQLRWACQTIAGLAEF